MKGVDANSCGGGGGINESCNNADDIPYWPEFIAAFDAVVVPKTKMSDPIDEAGVIEPEYDNDPWPDDV